MNDFSVTDALALAKNNGSADGFGGTWTWVFFLFFLLAWGGGGMFGGGNGASTSAAENALTRAAMYESNGMQDVFRNFGELTSQMNHFHSDTTDAIGNLRYDNLKNMNDLSSQIAQNRYAADKCCCDTNRNIDALKFTLSKEHSDGIQKIADMLNEDRIESLRAQLSEAKGQISNLMQSNNIINQVRPYPTPTYVVNSPYASAGYGYGNGCFGNYGFGY